MNPIQVPNGGGKQVNVLGIPIFIRLHGRDTGGVLSVVESHDAPGGGPPPHIHHREDETFQILEGDFEFSVGDRKIMAKQGATIWGTRRCRHTYQYRAAHAGKSLRAHLASRIKEFFEKTRHDDGPNNNRDIRAGSRSCAEKIETGNRRGPPRELGEPEHFEVAE